MNLKESTLVGAFWSFFTRFGTVLIEFSVQILLARILVPADFGILGMVVVFVNLGKVLTDSGFAQALIQKKDSTYIDECSMFYFNILIGTLFTIFLYLVSPLVADFYNKPILEDITKVLSFYFLINGFTVVQNVILAKKLDFKSRFFINILSISISGVTSIILALKGYGVWSLVAHVMLSCLITTLLLWIKSSWKPSLIFKWESIRSMLNYSLNILGSSMVTVIQMNIFAIVIGKAYSATALGYYSRANQLQNITSKTFTTSIQNVTFPAFSLIQTDLSLLKKGLRLSLQYLFFILTPIMLFFVVNADDIIEVLLGPKWIQSAYYLKLLAFIGIIFPLQMMNLNALKAIGLSKSFMKVNIWQGVFSIFSALITFQFGITEMVIGQLAVSLMSYLFNVKINGQKYNYTLKSQIQDLLPLIVLNLTFFTAIYVFSLFVLGYNIYLLMATKMLFAILIYMILTKVFKIPLLDNLLGDVKIILNKV